MRSRTLKKNKPRPQHLLIGPKPEQVLIFQFCLHPGIINFLLHSHLVLAPSCPPLAPPQQGFNSCPLKLLRLRLSWMLHNNVKPTLLRKQHTGGLYNMQMIVTLTGVLQLGRKRNTAASRRAYIGSTVTTAQS